MTIGPAKQIKVDKICDRGYNKKNEIGKSMSKKVRSSSRKFRLAVALNVIICIIALVVIAELVFNFMFDGIYIVQTSMEPTFKGATHDDMYGGDFVFIDVHSTPDYGDIVVVKIGETMIIKRLIAKSGDAVKLVDGKLYLKRAGADEFEAIDESYLDVEKTRDAAKNNFPVVGDAVQEGGHVVSDGYMFLLGDNRDVSLDSREFGDFPEVALCGVVADWSIKCKSTVTALHKFFTFTLPELFGKKVEIKGL